MWSGPRNISTAMMRAFENRPDTNVVDEPFYAAYLAATGADHPMRAAVLASQSPCWRDVVAQLLAEIPASISVLYIKQMTHHLLPGFGRHWFRHCRHAFLIRTPEAVLRSYSARRETVTLEDIGFAQQARIFDEVCDLLGEPPPVVDAADILADPQLALRQLCAALHIPFHETMLRWPAGSRATDGVWAPAWYETVNASTGFAALPARPTQPVVTEPKLDATLAGIAEAAWPFYAHVARFRKDQHAAGPAKA